MDFQPFPKIPRLSREIVISEKIDGTNASITINYVNAFSIDPLISEHFVETTATCVKDGLAIIAASRNKWITPKNDNAGFANWVRAESEELAKLGPGTHFGEWWGRGIQRGYGLGEKRFSLFNTTRWTPENAPKCCHVVPVLYRGIFNENAIWGTLEDLSVNGSKASPGFKPAEGIIIYHTAANMFFKKTIEKDEEYKSKYSANNE